MILVVDFNVVFSALVTSGKSRFVFELNNILGKFEFISIQYMYLELDNNLDRIVSLSKLPKEQILGLACERNLADFSPQLNFTF